MSGYYRTFSEHLDELRQRLKKVFLSYVIILIIVIFFPSDPVYSFSHLEEYLNLSFISHTIVAAMLSRIVRDILPSGWQLIAANGIGEGMEIYLIASLILALVIDMPVIAYETYKFIDPALTPQERSLVYPFVAAASLLFAAGSIFGYFVIAKFLIVSLAPFIYAAQISGSIDAASFYYVVFLVIGVSGISFTTPVFIYTLISLKIIDASFFTKNRILIWFVIWAVTGLLLTPDGGPLLDLIIFIPLVLMIELAVFLGKRKVGIQQDELKCKWCGNRITRENTFCPSCGRFNSLSKK